MDSSTVHIIKPTEPWLPSRLRLTKHILVIERHLWTRLLLHDTEILAEKLNFGGMQ